MRQVALASLLVAATFGCASSPDCGGEEASVPAPHEGAPEWVPSPTVVVARPPGTQVATHVWLPWDYNRQSVYPIDVGQSAFVRVRPMAGVGFATADLARITVFVEGRLATVRYRGTESRQVPVELVNGLGDVTIELPSEVLPEGLDTVQVVVGFHVDGAWAVTTTQTLFTVLSGSETAREYVDTVLEDTSSDYREGFRSGLTWRTPSGTESALLWQRERIPVDPVPVTLRLQAATSVQRCPEATDRFALVALLDGEPVSMGANERIVADMHGGEQRTLRFDLDLPQDEGPHRYELFYLPSLGRAARTGSGGGAVWAREPASVAVIQWGTE